MDGPDQRQPNLGDAERIVAELSTRQYLNPHRSLGQVLSDARDALGFCPDAAATALSWLKLDPALAVGRLRRGELIQLARSIHRFWRQSLLTHAPHSPSA